MENQEINKLLKQYNSSYKEMDEIYHSLALHYGLSDCALWILYLIRETEGALTQSQICEQFYLSKQTVNSALKKLEKEGYISLKSLADNQKSKQIFLTAAGERFTAKTIDHIFMAEQNALKQFSAEERRLFIQLSKKYVDQLGAESKKIINSK